MSLSIVMTFAGLFLIVLHRKMALALLRQRERYWSSRGPAMLKPDAKHAGVFVSVYSTAFLLGGVLLLIMAYANLNGPLIG